MIPDYRWESDIDANIKFELPGTWTQAPSKLETPHSFIGASPDGKIRLECAFITQGAVEVAHDERGMLSELEKQLTDVQVTKPGSRAMQNNLHVFGIAGRGKRGAVAVDWVFLAFGDGQGKGVLLNIIADDGEMEQKAATITRITTSVQQIGTAPATASN